MGCFVSQWSRWRSSRDAYHARSRRPRATLKTGSLFLLTWFARMTGWSSTAAAAWYRGAERVSPLRQRRATTSGTSLSTVVRRVSSHRRARAPAAIRSDPRCPAFVQQRQVVGALRLAYHVLHLLGSGVLARRLRVATLQFHAHAAPHVQRVGVPLLYSCGINTNYSSRGKRKMQRKVYIYRDVGFGLRAGWSRVCVFLFIPNTSLVNISSHLVEEGSTKCL